MIGETIGHYKILEKIGQGGMGEVYLAQDTTLDRKVALKFLPEELQQDPAARQRFLREAKSAAALDHPYICHIHEVGEVEGKSFISMEYVQGETLKDKLGRRPLPLNDALEKATEVAEALEEAHKQGIVHRDLKPSNIMLTPQAHVKVMDFGLAKRVSPVEGQEDEITTALTQQGSTLGTVPYMSPEQVRGQVVDTRSDIFSFGVTLYEMLSGVNPFKKGSPMDTATAILGETPPPLTRYTDDVPVLLQHTVRKMLAKEPDDRYQLIHEVRTDLAVLIREIEEVLAKPTTTPPTSQTPRRLQPWAMAVGLVLLTAIVTSLVLWSLIRSSPQPPLLETPVRKFELLVPSLGKDRRPPQISPDGTKIVYFSEGQLWIRELDQLQPRPLGSTQDALFPCWSPDSAFVAYLTDDGRLMKVPISGREPQMVAEVTRQDLGGNASCTWEPNGRILMAGVGDFGLLAVSSQGGDPEEIVPLNRGERDFHEVSQLPGGAVLFSTHAGAIEYFDGSTRKEILKMENEFFHWPIYSESGHLVYSRQTTNPGIWAAPFSLSRQEITGEAFLVVPDAAYPSLSQEGLRTLVYVPGVESDINSLVWVDRQGAVEPLGTPPQAYQSPRISPDGGRVTVPIVEEARPDIWVYDIPRQALTRLTFDSSNMLPLWTPDGRRVTWRLTGEGVPGNLFWKMADGTGASERLTTSEFSQFPGSWSPDGRFLAFNQQSSRASRRDLWILPLEGERKPQSILQTRFNEASPLFSPDGHWLAYVSDESGQNEIYVRPFPKVEEGKWQISTGEGVEPRWAADGRELFYRNESGDRMMVVNITTEPTFGAGTPRLLFEGSYQPSPGSTAYYDVTLDGQRFLMLQAAEQEAATNQINVVLNWFEELKRLVPR